jgi:hypothetical protein
MGVGGSCHGVGLTVDIFVFDEALFFKLEIGFGG